MNERREFTRVPLRFNIQLKGESELVLHAQTQDLSLRGVRISQLEQMKEGDDCELCLVLGDGDKAIHVEILGRVARVCPDSVGIEFTGIRGAESLEHLRRLVMYNAPDATQVEDDIRRHQGIQRRGKSE